jgi:hypothetical protein
MFPRCTTCGNDPNLHNQHCGCILHNKKVVRYVIVTSNHVYKGGRGYEGTYCSQVGVYPGFVYSNELDAEWNAKLLETVSSTGFKVTPFQLFKEV